MMHDRSSRFWVPVGKDCAHPMAILTTLLRFKDYLTHQQQNASRSAVALPLHRKIDGTFAKLDPYMEEMS